MTSPSVLPGPFLTRRQAARHAGVAVAELAELPGTVTLPGPWGLEEVYPAFQFARGGGFLAGLPGVVAAVGGVLAGRPAAAVEALAAGVARAA